MSPGVIAGKVYRNVYILESRAWWPSIASIFEPSCDLVLTFDFAMLREIDAQGGHCAYVDHLCDAERMQTDNFAMYRFFRDWHKDAEGRDILRHRDVDFGLALRIEIWNDFTYYVRLRLCLEELHKIDYEALFVGEAQWHCRDVLAEMGESGFVELPAAAAAPDGYYFPVHRWMNERLRARGWRRVARDAVIAAQGIAMGLVDRFADRIEPRASVFVQEYHSTRRLLFALTATPGLRVVQAHFSSSAGASKLWRERLIPVYGSIKKREPAARRLLNELRRRRSARLVLSGGIEATEGAYNVIEQRVSEVLARVLRNLDCVIAHLESHPIRLEVLIGNVGQIAMLVDAVAKSRGVPSYTIINGLLGNAYMDEAKYSTLINSYGPSIRDNYFVGMHNVVCLGDPRMDDYSPSVPRPIDRACPKIAIAAAGFNNIDLNSYVAFEFEFLHQVLTAIKSTGLKVERPILLKVRANGYSEDYRRFVKEWFGELEIQVVETGSIKELLADVDLFITFYSQTLFEASCLSIPCIFHKADNEIMDPPFDGRSEVVTTTNVDELRTAILDFSEGHERFELFLRRDVMEKYVGPLDGGNLRRNYSQVCRMMDLGGSSQFEDFVGG